jgi:hypothetical protein
VFITANKGIDKKQNWEYFALPKLQELGQALEALEIGKYFVAT